VIAAIRKSAGQAASILALAVLALAIGAYILSHERFRFPLIQQAPVEYKAELATAQAVAPGQGQTVRVSGIKVGDIGNVELRNGRAVVTMEIDPGYADIMHTDASVLLRPKTGLKDMFLELNPGSNRAPRAKAGFTIPVANTVADVNLDEVLSVLDRDTRDYLRLLVSGAGKGLRGRGDALHEVFRRFEPTHRDLARVTGKVAERRTRLRRLVRSLGLLSTELARKDKDLAELVGSSAAVFRAFASEQGNVSESVRLLPAALRQTRLSLGQVRTFADVLGPTAARLRPAARRLDDATAALRPLARQAAPLLHRPIRPLVRELRPLARDLRPAAKSLDAAAPQATRTGTSFNRALNMIAFNEKGRQGPADPARDEGYLFWLAWLSHDGSAIFSTADAHGPLRPITQSANCATWAAIAAGMDQGNPLVGIALRGLEGVFTDPRLCGSPQSTGMSFRKAIGAKGRGR
jgi:phospholipid/cholesterol/gamma-HCH transport system substrate-binding protein